MKSADMRCGVSPTNVFSQRPQGTARLNNFVELRSGDPLLFYGTIQNQRDYFLKAEAFLLDRLTLQPSAYFLCSWLRS